jgi:hypothetical protein
MEHRRRLFLTLAPVGCPNQNKVASIAKIIQITAAMAPHEMGVAARAEIAATAAPSGALHSQPSMSCPRSASQANN